jgi:hypothetical protein
MPLAKRLNVARTKSKNKGRLLQINDNRSLSLILI